MMVNKKLVKFRVGNVLCLRVEQVLRQVASKDKSKRNTHGIQTSLTAVSIVEVAHNSGIQLL
jgi:hypothetical protein